MRRSGAERRKVTSPADEVRHEQSLERGLSTFWVWKVGKKGVFFSRQRELHNKRYKYIKEHDVFDSIEHSEPVAKDEDGEDEITERSMCSSEDLDCMWHWEPLSTCELCSNLKRAAVQEITLLRTVEENGAKVRLAWKQIQELRDGCNK